MLSLSSPRCLQFPSLVHVGETQFSAWQEKGKSTTLYRLDWSRLDSEREQHWLKSHAKNQIQTSDQTFVLAEYPGSLPEPYDTWVKNMIFSVPRSYVDEIHRVCRMASIEWATERHFDTMIRDICLEPAIAYTYVGFRLLSDCLYDSKTAFFYRGNDKTFAPQALLYKFWSGQTGRGLLRSHARFEKISGRLEADVSKFISVIDEHEKRLEKAYYHSTESGSIKESTKDQ
jgi:hypothetical protein